MLSEEIVFQTWQRLYEMSNEQLDELMRQMQEEQPVYTAFMTHVSQSRLFNEEEGAVFMHICMGMWEMMRQSPGRMRQITLQELDSQMTERFKIQETMTSDTPSDRRAATKALIETFPEPEVLKYIVAVLEGPEEREPDDLTFREKSKALAALYLQAAVVALAKSLE